VRGGEFRYIRHGKPIPENWELVADFDNCHHGRYSQGIIRKKDEPDRCTFCGYPDCKPHYVAGHTQTTCCAQVLSTCCPGADQGETG